MRFLLTALALFLSACGVASGSGVVTTTTRDVGTFSRVSVSSGITLNASPGTKDVTVRTDDNLQSVVETVVEADTLVIRLAIPTAVIAFHAALEVNVVNEALEGVAASGGSRATMATTPASTFKLEASGGSDVTVTDLAVTDVTAEGTGGSTVIAAGTSTSARVAASGGSTFKLRDLALESLQVEASGGSQVHARVSTAISGSASGGSTITVVGTPSSTVDVSGGSEVRTGEL